MVFISKVMKRRQVKKYTPLNQQLFDSEKYFFFNVGPPKEDIFLDHLLWSILQSSSHNTYYKLPAGPLRAASILTSPSEIRSTKVEHGLCQNIAVCSTSKPPRYSEKQVDVKTNCAYIQYEVSLDEITRSMYGKFNCITINFERTQHRFFQKCSGIKTLFCIFINNLQSFINYLCALDITLRVLNT